LKKLAAVSVPIKISNSELGMISDQVVLRDENCKLFASMFLCDILDHGMYAHFRIASWLGKRRDSRLSTVGFFEIFRNYGKNVAIDGLPDNVH
jgi:hypothetical protein